MWCRHGDGDNGDGPRTQMEGQGHVVAVSPAQAARTESVSRDAERRATITSVPAMPKSNTSNLAPAAVRR